MHTAMGERRMKMKRKKTSMQWQEQWQEQLQYLARISNEPSQTRTVRTCRGRNALVS